VLLNRQKIKFHPEILSVLALISAVTVTITALVVVAWYLFSGPGLKDIFPPVHLYMIESIASLPAPEAHNELRSVLVKQGYVSIVQLNDISEMATVEAEALLEQKLKRNEI